MDRWNDVEREVVIKLARTFTARFMGSKNPYNPRILVIDFFSSSSPLDRIMTFIQGQIFRSWDQPL